MKSVTRDEITAAWNRLGELDKAQTDALVQQFMQEQPAIGVYLSANAESFDAKDFEASPLIDLAVACWVALSHAAAGRLRTVSPEVLDRAEAANTRALEKLDEAPKPTGTRACWGSPGIITSGNCSALPSR